MFTSRSIFVVLCFIAFVHLGHVNAEPIYDEEPAPSGELMGDAPKGKGTPLPPSETVRTKQHTRKTASEKSDKEKDRKYFVPDPQRIDAGVFHVGFAVGGNFYMEPKFSLNTRGQRSSAPTGDYFKDFGFQAGVYFDYDYSALTENVPLGLRGMIGYKYILSSVHIFAFDGLARYMFRTSDKSTFGLGAGVSAAMWYRAITDTSVEEQVLFLPSFVLGAGFEYNPFMVDFKWLIQNFSSAASIFGFELYFGLRL